MQYTTIFEVTNNISSWQSLLAIAGPLILFGWIIFLQRHQIAALTSSRTRQEGSSDQARPAIPLACIVIVVGCIALGTLVGLVVFAQNQSEAQRILREGKASVVEGPVENFKAISKTEAGRWLNSDTFTVQGVTFDYSELSNTPGYHQVSARDGAINKDGIYVRIHYAKITSDQVSPTILKLEIGK
jgi:hypothetical protein